MHALQVWLDRQPCHLPFAYGVISPKVLGGAAGSIGMSGLTVALSLLTLLFTK